MDLEFSISFAQRLSMQQQSLFHQVNLLHFCEVNGVLVWNHLLASILSSTNHTQIPAASLNNN